MKRRHLILLLGGASSGALSVGSGAFSSVEAEREAEVNVVEDEKAFVGYETPPENENGNVPVSDEDEDLKLVTIRNRFGENREIGLVGFDIKSEADIFEDVTISIEPPGNSSNEDEDEDEHEDEDHQIEVSNPETKYNVEEPEKTFGPPGKAHITAGISDISIGQTVDIEITITVRGSGVKARLFGDTRAFTLVGPDIENVIFNGGGNAMIPEDLGVVQAEARFSGQGGSSNPNSNSNSNSESVAYTVKDIHWNSSKNLKESLSGQGSSTLLAVRFPATDQVFINSQKSSKDDDALPADWLDGNAEVIESNSSGN